MTLASTPPEERPQNALYILQSPDGYYKYLQVPKPKAAPATAASASLSASLKEAQDEVVNIELIKRQYRRLSLRHHPDRRGGDAETFRVLNRAKRVLTHSKLRKQYDLLGLDLEEDEDDDDEEDGVAQEAHENDNNDDTAAATNDNNNKEEEEEEKKKKKKTKTNGGDESSSSNSGGGETVIGRLASAALASILQFTVRTAMMGLASTLLCRFRWTLIPAVLVLSFVSFRIFTATRSLGDAKLSLWASLREASSPLWIAAGLTIMHVARLEKSNDNNDNDMWWSWKFCAGETLVLSTFVWNSLVVTQPTIYTTRPLLFLCLIGTASFVVCLLLRGKWTRYTLVVLLELALAVSLLVVFPVMELIVEEIVQEKLRKVGDKVRAHSQRMEQVYAAKMQTTTTTSTTTSTTRTMGGSGVSSHKMNAMD